MKYKAIRGMEDILPPDTKIWQQLEEKARSELEFYGFLEIRTPLLEDTSIFVRSIGEDTDIVTKEMYTFKDRKERSLTLRPEGTASIVRAYIEHSLDKISSRLQFYYIGPMFRSERPQRGRSRQFHQIGVEVFGSNSPYADAEVIKSASNLLKALGLSDFIIKINSLGCVKDKDKFAEKLKGYLTGKKNRLC
ncbi:MAG: histidine--tRNA ligase, partial [Candidatus Omnitrophica bacterium]|nr:histidine--tRNA ligase [Candidatus Omnitrophota bacterium]